MYIIHAPLVKCTDQILWDKIGNFDHGYCLKPVMCLFMSTFLIKKKTENALKMHCVLVHSLVKYIYISQYLASHTHHLHVTHKFRFNIFHTAVHAVGM